MRPIWRMTWLAGSVLALCTACSGDDDDGGQRAAMGGAGNATQGQTLCEKYGGAAAVEGVVKQHVIGKIAGDCRINAFFTALEPDAFTRVGDCLTIQVQELFGCSGVTYAGASASNGLACRSMTAAHAGLGIAEADFTALIEDVVAGLGAAGVAEADIMAAAPALLGMQDEIVTSPASEPTRDACQAGAGGAAP